MSALAYAILALSVPFLFGIVVGIEIKRRRPPTTHERFGALMEDRILSVMKGSRWLETGSGWECNNSTKLELEGKTVEILIRTIA